MEETLIQQFMAHVNLLIHAVKINKASSFITRLALLSSTCTSKYMPTRTEDGASLSQFPKLIIPQFVFRTFQMSQIY